MLKFAPLLIKLPKSSVQRMRECYLCAGVSRQNARLSGSNAARKSTPHTNEPRLNILFRRVRPTMASMQAAPLSAYSQPAVRHRVLLWIRIIPKIMDGMPSKAYARLLKYPVAEAG
jgi:hypothetical protein